MTDEKDSKTLWEGYYIALFENGTMTVNDGVGYVGEEDHDLKGLLEALKKVFHKDNEKNYKKLWEDVKGFIQYRIDKLAEDYEEALTLGKSPAILTGIATEKLGLELVLQLMDDKDGTTQQGGD
jgi:hypothetical protein